MDLTGPDFLQRKESILEALDLMIERGNMDRLSWIRQNKRTL